MSGMELACGEPEMKLRTSLQVSAVFPVALAIIVTLSIFIRSRSLAESRRELGVSEEALPMVSQLNAALYSYISKGDGASKAAWIGAHERLAGFCQANRESGGVFGFLIAELDESAAKLASVADRAAAGEGEMGVQAGKEMSVLFARAFRLLSVSRHNAEVQEQATETVFLVFVAVFAMLMTGSLFAASSRIMKRLNSMSSVCDNARAGDLTQRLDLKGDDELADFGRSFNALLQKLDREQAKLRDELGHHRKGEETRDSATAAAREGNMRLADALTKLKRAQVEIVQQERVRALEQVITGVARDFNDLLAPVLTMSDFLLDFPQKLEGRDDLKEDIRVINSSARKALRQVRVLTDLFQSFEEPFPQKLRLSDMVDSAEGLVAKGSRHDLSAYNIVRDFDDVPFIVGNEVDYMEAIRNLIENALEAMHEGGTLKISIKNKGKVVLLTVQDDGSGMSDEVYKRMLEPFFSTKGKGHSGMGLTFVVVAIGKFGGSLDVRSSAGQGTTVTLTIPVFDQEIHKKKETDASEPLPDKLKLLVIDDEEWTRVVLSRALSAEGHNVVTAGGGVEGINLFKAGKFDVVILDRAMPQMTGDEVAARIAAEESGVAVIMLTGFGDIMKEKGEEVKGVDLILSKPITILDLKTAIGRALKEKKSS